MSGVKYTFTEENLQKYTEEVIRGITKMLPGVIYNKNVLINADFTSLINQEGKSVYTNNGGWKPCVDYWWMGPSCESFTVDNTGQGIIKINGSGKLIGQKIDFDKSFRNTTVTVSGLIEPLSGIENLRIYCHFHNLPVDQEDYNNVASKTFNQYDGFTSLTFNVPNNADCMEIWIYSSKPIELTFKPIEFKLEPGPIQTLACKDVNNGWWRRNTIFNNKAEELYKCKKKYFRERVGGMLQRLSESTRPIGITYQIPMDVIPKEITNTARIVVVDSDDGASNHITLLTDTGHPAMRMPISLSVSRLGMVIISSTNESDANDFEGKICEFDIIIDNRY